jgi:selenide,water dikinase
MNLADPDHLREAVMWMKHLNQTAGEIASSLNLRGGTDITGFGLLGHAWEMAEASQVTLHISYEQVPFMSGVRIYAEQGVFPGGTASNYSAYCNRICFDEGLNEDQKLLLFDAQTSGGLLLAIPLEKLSEFSRQMEIQKEPYWVIGEVAGRESGIQVF